ncbi:MAG: hypothetical protein ABIZ30_04655 [Candidatus Limnocylindrales bacterium]
MTDVVIVPRNVAEAALWRMTIEVAELFAGFPWVIVGAQMVLLLEFERGQASGRATLDLDAIVDARAVAGATRLAAEQLIRAGFSASIERPYRFKRDEGVVDLLAPDHLGRRADLTTIPPHSTTAIPGGTRALSTRRLVDVDVTGVGSGSLPLPTLAGAIVLKTASYESRRERRDLEDLVRLLALVEDVEAVRRALEPAERRRLGAVMALRDQDHRAWLIAADREDARAAFDRLADD